MSGTSLLIALSTCFSGFASSKVPEVLVKAFLQRTHYQTAFFKYRRITNLPDVGRRTERFEARFSGDSVYLIEKGGDDGIRLRQPLTLEPLLGVRSACLPKRMIFDRENDDWWIYYDSLNHLGLWSGTDRPVISDVRSFGLYARNVQEKMPVDMLQVLYDSEKRTRWDVTEKDGLKVVRCRVEMEGDGEGYLQECEWRIDRAKDFAIVQVTETYLTPEGKRVHANRLTSDYVCKRGKWWPRKSESVAHTGYSYCIEYEHVEFDRPDHPRRIGPELLGIPVGAVVYAAGFEPDGRYLGNGNIVDSADWEAIRDQYDLAPLKAFWAGNAAMGRGCFPGWWEEEGFGLDGLAHTPDLWEAYVRRWILKRTSTGNHTIPHPLSQDQVNAAWAILRDCRKKAAPILDSIAKRIAAIDRALDSSGSPSSSAGGVVGEAEPEAPEANRQEARSLARRRAELEKPQPKITQLFSELKQRLDDLLRLPQRMPAGTSPPGRAAAEKKP